MTYPWYNLAELEPEEDVAVIYTQNPESRPHVYLRRITYTDSDKSEWYWKYWEGEHSI